MNYSHAKYRLNRGLAADASSVLTLEPLPQPAAPMPNPKKAW